MKKKMVEVCSIYIMHLVLGKVIHIAYYAK